MHFARCSRRPGFYPPGEYPGALAYAAGRLLRRRGPRRRPCRSAPVRRSCRSEEAAESVLRSQFRRHVCRLHRDHRRLTRSRRGRPTTACSTSLPCRPGTAEGLGANCTKTEVYIWSAGATTAELRRLRLAAAGASKEFGGTRRPPAAVGMRRKDGERRQARSGRLLDQLRAHRVQHERAVPRQAFCVMFPRSSPRGWTRPSSYRSSSSSSTRWLIYVRRNARRNFGAISDAPPALSGALALRPLLPRRAEQVHDAVGSVLGDESMRRLKLKAACAGCSTRSSTSSTCRSRWGSAPSLCRALLLPDLRALRRVLRLRGGGGARDRPPPQLHPSRRDVEPRLQRDRADGARRRREPLTSG